MLVNIWATIVHLGDNYFCGAEESKEASLDLLISEKLRKVTAGKQTWMISPFWLSPGTTGALLRESYYGLHDTRESYLVLMTPGFADTLLGVPSKLVERQLDELGRRAGVLNKKIITVMMGVPPRATSKIAQSIQAMNKVHAGIARKNGWMVADLRKIRYAPWDHKGSRPLDLPRVADIIVKAVLDSHAL